MKHKNYFNVYITNILSSNYGVSIYIPAKKYLNNILYVIAKEICKISVRMVFHSTKKTLTLEHIDKAMRIVLFEPIIDINELEDRDEIEIPCYIFNRMLYTNIPKKSSIIISKGIPKAISIIIAKFCKKILTGSVCNMERCNRERITIQDILETMNENVDINKVYIKYLLKIPKIIDKRDFIICKKSFEKIIRRVIEEQENSHETVNKIEKGVFHALQVYIENYIVNLLKVSNSICNHSNRKKMTKEDILMVIENHLDVSKI